jgi:aryl-alcohol dehydrogenase-like predicted oxidoreductase
MKSKRWVLSTCAALCSLPNPDQQESFALLDYAFERGVNFLDTAEL